MNTEPLKNEFINELVPYRIKNKWWFADRKKNIIIDCKYEAYKGGQANDFFHEKLAKVRLNNKYGVIDNSGKIVIPCTYDLAQTFTSSSTVIGVDQKQGVISTSGELVLPISDALSCNSLSKNCLVLNNSFCFWNFNHHAKFHAKFSDNQWNLWTP